MQDVQCVIDINVLQNLKKKYLLKLTIFLVFAYLKTLLYNKFINLMHKF